MPLVKMSTLLKKVKDTDIAVGAFNVSNMEMVIGAVKAAQEANTPIILQIAQGRLRHSPLQTLAPIMVEAAKNASVDIAVHLDHGKTIECAKQALDYGFTSIMYDGSDLPLEENIKNTNEFSKLARSYGADIEAEIGIVGGSEDETDGHECKGTNINDAVTFLNSADIDALAVAIGNAHGLYKGVPKLDFERLKALHDNLDIPLVLHGGTGILPLDYQLCAENGMCKINIATNNFMAFTNSVKDYINSTAEPNYFEMNEKMVDGVCESIEKHIHVFNKGEIDEHYKL